MARSALFLPTVPAAATFHVLGALSSFSLVDAAATVALARSSMICAQMWRPERNTERRGRPDALVTTRKRVRFCRRAKRFFVISSCLPCGGHTRLHNERLCLCRAQGDDSREFPLRPGRQVALRYRRLAAWSASQP